MNKHLLSIDDLTTDDIEALFATALEMHEVQHRVVLLLNHVLMQESAATQRLVPSRGRVVRMQWRHFFMALRVTPAGLFDLAPPAATPLTGTRPRRMLLPC